MAVTNSRENMNNSSSVETKVLMDEEGGEEQYPVPQESPRMVESSFRLDMSGRRDSMVSSHLSTIADDDDDDNEDDDPDFEFTNSSEDFLQQSFSTQFEGGKHPNDTRNGPDGYRKSGHHHDSRSGRRISNSSAAARRKHRRRRRKRDGKARSVRKDGRVAKLRLVVMFVLIAAAASVCFLVIQSLQTAERRAFELQFNDDASHIVAAATDELSNKLSAMDSLAIAVQSFAANSASLRLQQRQQQEGQENINSNHTTLVEGQWPLVTVPDFPLRAVTTMEAGQAIGLALHPFVNNSTRQQWESYSFQRARDWYLDDLVFKEIFPTAYSNVIKTPSGTRSNNSRRNLRRRQEQQRHQREETLSSRRNLLQHDVSSSAFEHSSSTRSLSAASKSYNNNNVFDPSYRSLQPPGRSQYGISGNADKSGSGGDTHNEAASTSRTTPTTRQYNSPLEEKLSKQIPRISEEIFNIVVGKIERAETITENSVNDGYFPLWQYSNVDISLSMVNWDLSRDEFSSERLRQVKSTKQATMSEMYLQKFNSKYGFNFPEIQSRRRRHLDTSTQHDLVEDKIEQQQQQRHEQVHRHDGEEENDKIESLSIQDSIEIVPNQGLLEREGPAVTFYFPIFDHFDDGNDDGDDEDDQRSVVAVLAMTTLVDTFLYPSQPHALGLIIVINDNCGNVHTFETKENGIIEHVGETGSLDGVFEQDVVQTSLTNDGTSFTNIPLLTDAFACHLTIQIYPSKTTHDEWMTDSPIISTVIVGAIFLFVAIILCGYDCLVERHQTHLAETANRSSAIVSAMFPEVVRDRLLEGGGVVSAPSSLNGSVAAEAGTSRRSVVNDHSGKGGGTNEPTSATSNGGNRVSEYYNKGLRRIMVDTNYFSSSSSFEQQQQHSQRRGSGGGVGGSHRSHQPPIADLFPAATVMFGDIAGFTAWSSSREPGQVFTLLEALYGAFDRLAKKMHVFKVETVGDCYVAVTGLPIPQSDHAPRMVRFANSCLTKMKELTQELEVILGPDTNDLGFRIGLHSGPVTAGVLRGERSRFQLFGDTVNMASRMESTGKRDHIQVSEATADLLIRAGKSNWIVKRAEVVTAKGKGDVETYWIRQRSKNNMSSTGHASADTFATVPSTHSQMLDEAATTRSDLWGRLQVHEGRQRQRLIDWQVELLSGILKRILAKHEVIEQQKLKSSIRGRAGRLGGSNGLISTSNISLGGGVPASSTTSSTTTTKNLLPLDRDSDFLKMSKPREEITEAIKMPKEEDFFSTWLIDDNVVANIELSSKVQSQLQDLVISVALLHHTNQFHSYDHACHVTMSANKLLRRIVRMNLHDKQQQQQQQSQSSSSASQQKGGSRGRTKHKTTFGLTSDPLTQFAIIFSAMIHDLDHPGVSNGQMVKESDRLAGMYDNLSVSEQNSICLGWEILTSRSYDELLACICSNDEAEFKRFRQLVVNCVMATDVFDKELLEFRNKRWAKAFYQKDDVGSSLRSSVTFEDDRWADDNSVTTFASTTGGGGGSSGSHGSSEHRPSLFDLKATIVIEHIMQAADVSHTMQHWHVYTKWNEKLFAEVCEAYEAGRGSKEDPVHGWYKGELIFFDKYVIPLARKLAECGVFGVSSAECLNYALENRKEWAAKGQEVVKVWAEKHRRQEDQGTDKDDDSRIGPTTKAVATE